MKPSIHTATSTQVFYLGADQRLLTDLAPLIDPKGLCLTPYTSPADLVAVCRRAPPAVLIVDLSLLPGMRGLQSFLDAITQGAGHCPELICIASGKEGDQSMECRLEALRVGARGYVPRSVPAERLARRVIRLCGLADTRRYRILVMDEDPSQVQYIAALLNTAGMETFALDDPMRILDTMQRFRPNLILMGLDMPGATGAELAAIIRDQDDYFGMPILFLSAETDLDKQLEALKAGGDGFIAKPVRPNQLIGKVEHRIRMSRWLKDRRTLINRDETATGFLPRYVFMSHLDRLVRADVVQDDGRGLLIIDLDEPKRLLKALGLGGTEKLLRQIEARLGNHMTPEESATRLDDSRYALLARRDSRERLQDLATRLCGMLAEIRPQDQAEGKDLETRITVSIGIGLFMPQAGDAITLISRGEKAAVTASRAGGNQVRVWTPLVSPSGTPEAEAFLKRLVKAALAQDGLLLLFQPIVPLDPEEVEVYEAQLRLRAMDGEQIPPADFLPVAECGGLMPEVDRWVLAHALGILDAQRVTHPRLRLLVHQSVATLVEQDWFSWFRDQVVQRNLIRRLPLLQFQMLDIQRNIVQAKAVMENLRRYGIQVSVANVTGTAEEAMLLSRLCVAFARLSFQTIGNREQGELVDIIERFHEQGVSVIAAGIEDSATIARVWNCRPDFVQGNYLRMPGSELSFDFKHLLDDI